MVSNFLLLYDYILKNLENFLEKQSVSFIKSKTSKAPKRQPKTKSSSSPIKATSSSSSSVGYADDNFENVDSVKYTPNDVEEFGGDDEIEAEIISIPKGFCRVYTYLFIFIFFFCH